MADPTAAWNEASRDLGVEIDAPYVLEDDSLGSPVECLAFLRHFGSDNGAIVIARSAPRIKEVQAVARRRKIFWAVVDDALFSTYSRYMFQGTINDWGWFGDRGSRPDWCTGVGWPL